MQFAFIASLAVSAIGAVMQGAEQASQYKAEEANSRLQAKYQAENAHTELQIAAADADNVRRRGREVVAEQTAALGQTGFALTDSAGLMIENSATNAELDALNTQYKGVLRSRGEQIGYGQSIAQAEAYKSARSAIPAKTGINVASAVLSGYARGQGQRIA